MNSLKAHHYNGSATTTPAEINPGRLCQKVIVANLDPSVGLQISFDGGRTFFTILGASTFSEYVLCHSFWIRSASGSVAYSAIVLG